MAALKATKSISILSGLAAVFLIAFFSSASAQSPTPTITTFTSGQQFPIPQLHGSVSFAINGSYSSATLENNTWIFRDLRLNDSQRLGTLKFSTENSNTTIIAYRTYGTTFGGSGGLTYYAEGAGKQTLNLGFNKTDVTQWSVIVNDNVFLAVDQGWKFLPDNTLVIEGQTGVVSVIRFGFGNPYDDSDQPFYMRHSIMIVTVAVLAVVAALAVVVRRRR